MPPSYPPFSGILGVATGGGGGGGGAPVNATYLTLSLDGVLTQERVFAPSADFTPVDGGGGGNYTFNLSNTGVVAAAYTDANVTVDAKGRVTAISSGAAPVTAVNVDVGELTSTGGLTPTLGLANAGTAGTYAYPSSLTTDAFGRVTAVTAGSAPVTSTVAVDAGELTNTGTATAAVLGLATTGVVAGAYTSVDLTVDSFGRITTISNGSGTYSVVTTSASPYSVATTVTTVFANPGADQTIELPAANAVGVTPGRPYTIKRVNTSVNTVTVTTAGGTLDGAAPATGIALAGGTYNSMTVQSDGTNWWVV